ncbi:mammalian ependymin-related protein 1 [Patella vulgata]|uniref:mammalian ependymin-related protein 1 n=1 Tax=Patella vulgata TaxID=6465 RepID=UPI002180509E|nr:mammalian ependymin-related protein 1 [Patella vulgata]
MKLLLLCLAVAYVAGQVPLPCVSPRQFEGRFMRFDRERQLQEYAKISYDEDQRRVREIEEREEGSEREYFDKLYLHNIGLEYRFNLKTRQCNATAISRSFTPFGVPNGANFSGIGVLGVSGIPNEHVNVEFFEGRYENNPYFIAVTQPGCFPVQFGYYSEQTGYDHRTFIDVTLGVPDPNVFIPPKECIG